MKSFLFRKRPATRFKWHMFGRECGDSNLVQTVVMVPSTSTWCTSNFPFSLMIAIDPPLCPDGAAKAHTPRTAASTRIWAELLLLSSRTVAFLLMDSRWFVTLTSRCQACTVPVKWEWCVQMQSKNVVNIPTFFAPDRHKRCICVYGDASNVSLRCTSPQLFMQSERTSRSNLHGVFWYSINSPCTGASRHWQRILWLWCLWG